MLIGLPRKTRFSVILALMLSRNQKIGRRHQMGYCSVAVGGEICIGNNGCIVLALLSFWMYCPDCGKLNAQELGTTYGRRQRNP